MKKLISILIFSVLFTSNIYSQSGWVSSFFNNTCYFSKIVKRDSLNIFAFGNYSKYYYKSTDAGNTWVSNPNISLDSVCGIYDGQFINSQTGWIVGATRGAYFGIILKTTNGGINWIQKLFSYNDYIFRSVYFLNSNTGWAGTRGTGGVGRLYKTTNGGDNWDYQDFLSQTQIHSVKFFDTNNGWILGQNGLVAKTTDSGLNWTNKPINNLPPNYSNFNYCLAPITFNDIWVLVISSSSNLKYSRIFNTTNGGDIWELKYIYTDSLNTSANNFGELNFNNFSTGFAIGGYNFILRTSDAGSNWNKIFYSTSLGYNYSTNSLLYLNSNDLIAAGGYANVSNWTGYFPYNFILKSTNSGLNWSVKSINNEYRFTQIEFIDANTGFVLADTGRIYKTTNGGMNWSLNYRPIASWYWLNKISFANSSTGCVIGNSSPTYCDHGRIYRTTNKGDNWTEVFYSSIRSVFSLKFIDQQNGFAGYDSSRLLKTTNSGLNWNILNLTGPMPFDINDIYFINNSSGWALGHYYHYMYPPPITYERNVIWRTTDSGNNWSIIFDSIGITENYYIQFVDNNVGYKFAYKSNYLQKTTNGGANWFNINVLNITTPSSIKFINENTGWICGVNSSSLKVVVKTTNGGNNWYLQFSDYYKKPLSIYAFNSDNAWFCGEYSSIYKTTDGGGNIGIRKINTSLPSSFSLFQNYPNPFNPSTNIRYQITNNKLVTLKIYDILGKEIETLVNEKQSPGTYEVIWNASAFPSGIYFYKIISGNYSETKKMILLK